MGSAGLPLMLLLAGVLARIPGSEGGKETPAHFLYQTKHECSFLNGTRRVRFLQRYFYDRQEYLRFDSARGEFEAVTALGKGDARAWNRNQRLLLDAKASVDYFCRANCEALQGGAVIGRRELRSSNLARSKLWTGIVAAVIGVIFFAMGLSLYLKSKKATPIQPPAAPLSPRTVLLPKASRSRRTWIGKASSSSTKTQSLGIPCEKKKRRQFSHLC